MSLPWKAGTPYFLYTYHLGGGLWGAWAIDGVTGVVTTIGTVSLSPQNTKLFHVTMTSTSWVGTPATACAKFPRSQAMFLAPVGFVGGQLSSASPGRPEVWGTGCAAVARTEGPWTVYEVGTP